MIKFDLTELIDQILLFSMVQTCNLKYFKHFWIIKCVSLESIIFAINLDIVSSSKFFNTFNFVFLSIILLT